MNKLIKLIILIIMCSSVYYVYNITNNSKYTVLNLGDKLSLGINSYGIKEYSYIDYYRDTISQDKQKVKIINKYAHEDQSIKSILESIKNTNAIKKDLTTSDIIIMTLGYNDILYGLALEENYSDDTTQKVIKKIETEYNELIKEIKKYHHKKIIVIGYYQSPNKEVNEGIVKLNKILSTDKNVNYINTYQSLPRTEKYFSNPNSYYPNNIGYKAISTKIINKTLEFY